MHNSSLEDMSRAHHTNHGFSMHVISMLNTFAQSVRGFIYRASEEAFAAFLSKKKDLIEIETDAEARWALFQNEI